jgi:hypothetical protein
VKGAGVKGEGRRNEGWRVKASVVKIGGTQCERRRARLSGEDSLRTADVSKRKTASTVPE